MKKPAMPAGLGAIGRDFWEKVLDRYLLEDAHDLERLGMAAKCLDEIAEAEAAVKSAGMFVRDRYGSLRDHPGVRVLRDTRTLFARLIRELALDITEPTESRPPRRY